MTKVRDILDTSIPSVSPTASMTEVTEEMKQSRVDMVVVSDRGKYRGLIEGGNVATRMSAKRLNLKKTTAKSLANKDWPLISPGADTWDALKVMVRNHVEVLPVVQNGRLVGVFTLEEATRDSPALRAMALISSQRSNRR
ncbi:MAG: cyclic nucleotide-binding/CBS domain-containing protein [Chloroflexota bacterium]